MGRKVVYDDTTFCTGCKKEVTLISNTSINNCGIAWIIYSVFFWPYFLFLFRIQAFKTITHECPTCGMILSKITPSLTTRERTGLMCAVSFHIALIIFGIFGTVYYVVTSVSEGAGSAVVTYEQSGSYKRKQEICNNGDCTIKEASIEW